MDPEEPAELQFQTLEPVGAPPALVCATCTTPIATRYFEADRRIVCERCRHALDAGAGTPVGRWARALVLGVGAAIAGALLYFGVREITGYDIGLVSIAVGFLVGHAVFVGSHRRGGRSYQMLAVVLTYVSIAATLAPAVITGLMHGADEHRPAAAAHSTTAAMPAGASPATTTAPSAQVPAPSPAPGLVRLLLTLVVLAVFVVVFTLAAPIWLAFKAPEAGLIELLIIGFGVWRAWRMNQRRVPVIRGPYVVSQRPNALDAG